MIPTDGEITKYLLVKAVPIDILQITENIIYYKQVTTVQHGKTHTILLNFVTYNVPLKKALKPDHLEYPQRIVFNL